MSWFDGMLARGRLLFRRRAADARIEREFGFHIDMETERLVRENHIDPEEARRRAIVTFGAVESRKEELRDDRGFAWISGLALDLRLAVRMLKKYPGLTVVGVAGMGMAVALGATMFTMVELAMHPTLPLPEGDRIVGIRTWDRRANAPAPGTLHDFGVFREALSSMNEVGVFRMNERNLIFPDGTAEPAFLAEMTASAFRATRTAPLLGRYILEPDEPADSPPVVVISYRLWQSHFSGDPAVLGRIIKIGAAEHTVVGVMPRGFAFPVDQTAWTPLRLDPVRVAAGAGPDVRIFARLAPRITSEAAQAELASLGRRMSIDDPRARKHLEPRIVDFPALVGLLDETEDLSLIPLLFTMVMVLICIDVATLVYARTATRQAEIAVRASLGASRGRIIGQLFTEALVLSAVASAVGLGVARVAFGVMMSGLKASGSMLPFWMQPRLSPGTVVYVAGLTALAAVIIGILPARSAARHGVRNTLSQLSTGATVRLGRAWTVLIVAQVGVAVAVLPGVVTLSAVYGWYSMVSPGFPAGDYLTARLEFDNAAMPTDTTMARETRLARLERRLESEPGVSGVTYSSGTPGQELFTEIEIEQPDSGTVSPRPRSVRASSVAANFFHEFSVPLLAGRAFTVADATSGAAPVVVNASFVREMLGGHSAIGRRIRIAREGNNRTVAGRMDANRDGTRSPDVAPEAQWKEIIGVVADFPPNRMNAEVTEARMYEPMQPGEQYPLVVLSAHVRLAPAALGDRLRRIAIAVDPGIRLSRIFPLDEVYRQGERKLARMAALMMGLITLSLLVLSAAGMYSLMSFTVTRRRREIGIRAALGANPRHLLAGVFARAVRQLALGGAVGLFFTAALDRWSGGELLGGHGAIVLPAVLALMMVTGILAALGPARRGLRIHPADALKSE